MWAPVGSIFAMPFTYFQGEYINLFIQVLINVIFLVFLDFIYCKQFMNSFKRKMLLK